MSKTYIAFDNGVSGSIGIVTPEGEATMYQTPTRKVLKYTKKRAYISRLDYIETKNILEETLNNSEQVFCFLERPLVNPTRFQASLSAVRCLEATEILLEELGIPYAYIDSKEWQKAMMPKGISGSSELKKASAMVGTRLFPHLKQIIDKQKDADGILMAEYARRKNL